MRPRAWAWRLSAAGLLALGLWQAGLGLWIPAKAAVAQLLLHAAWARTTAGAAPSAPWPWADFRPLAALEVGDDRYIVVSDGAGESLAFAPSHVAGTAEPGKPGNAVVAAHRDTHFAGLDALQPEQSLTVSGLDGARTMYTIRQAMVLDRPQIALPEDGVNRLVLVTCWPLRSLRPDPTQRYVVVAEQTREGFDG